MSDGDDTKRPVVRAVLKRPEGPVKPASRPVPHETQRTYLHSASPAADEVFADGVMTAGMVATAKSMAKNKTTRRKAR